MASLEGEQFQAHDLTVTFTDAPLTFPVALFLERRKATWVTFQIDVPKVARVRESRAPRPRSRCTTQSPPRPGAGHGARMRSPGE